MTEYVMGVDHGGTKTKAVIADLSGRIHAVTTLTKAAEPSYDDLAVTAKAIGAAMQQAELTPRQIVQCTVGFSGADWDFQYEQIRGALANRTGIAPLHVVNDCIGAMRGGTASPFGGIICIGTGLNIGLINRQGESFVYGYLINDEDSGGTALGKWAVQAVRNAYTGVGPQTVLSRWLPEYFRQVHKAPLETVYDFLVADTTGSAVLPRLRYEVKELAPLLIQAGEEEDPAAVAILDGFCRRLSDYVYAAAKRLGMTEEAFELILSGGVMRTGSLIRKRLSAYIGERLPQAEVRPAAYEPVCGCVLLSYDRRQNTESVKARFREEAALSGLLLEAQEEKP